MDDAYISHGLKLGVPYHVGIAVHNVDEAVKRYGEIFQIREWRGMESPSDPANPPVWHGKPVPGAGLKWSYSNTEWPMLEFVQPLGNVDWTVPRFLRERGEGVYHLGYFVDDIRAALREAEEKGIEAEYLSVNEVPGVGAMGIAYMSPKNTNGVSIELVSANLRDTLTNFVRTGQWPM